MKNKKPEYNKFVILALYIVIVIILIFISNNLFVRIDLTKNEIYTLSDASKSALSTLEEPLTVKAFFSKNLPNPYNTIEQQVRDLFEEFAVLSPKHFNFTFYEMSGEEDSSNEDVLENQRAAQEYSVYPVQIQNIENDEISLQNVYMGLAFIHGDMIETIPSIQTAYQLEYRITSTIQKMNNKISAILALNDNIKITFYYSSQLGDAVKQLSNDLESIVNEMNKQHNNKLEYSFYDTFNNPSIEAEAEKYSAHYIEIPKNEEDLVNGIVNEEEIEIEKAYIGIVISYKDDYSQIPLITRNFFGQPELLPLESVEKLIKMDVEDLIGINQEIGYLTSNDTKSLYELSSFYNELSQNYTITQVDLSDKELSSIPHTLIIAGPKTPFSEYELFLIDQHLMRGNSLAIFLDTHDIMDLTQIPEYAQYAQQMQQQGQAPIIYTPLDLGLERLLEHYGINIEKAFVLDENSYSTISQDQMGRQMDMNVYFAPWVPANYINSELSITKHLNDLLLLNVSPLSYDPEKQENIEAHLLFSSSDTSWQMVGNINLHDPMTIMLPIPEEQKSQELSYILEGNFTSYFKGREIPNPVTEEELTEELTEGSQQENVLIPEDLIVKEISIIEESNGGKIFVFGSSDLLADNLFIADPKLSNSVFVLNVLDYLNDREEQAVLRSKVQTLPSLNDDITPETKFFVKAFNIFIIPVFVIAFGIFMLINRTRRRKQIQLTFSKENDK